MVFKGESCRHHDVILGPQERDGSVDRGFNLLRGVCVSNPDSSNTDSNFLWVGLSPVPAGCAVAAPYSPCQFLIHS
jgi:hypothetical protein